MSVINTGSHPKLLWPGVKKVWGVNYSRHDPIWKKIFKMDSSEQNYEEDVEEVGFGLMSVKTQGGGISYDTAQQGTVTRYTHTTFALGYMVTMEEMMDNLYEKASYKRAAKLARSVYETEEIDHAAVLNRAFSSSYTGGDGVELISTAHPTASGNQSNELTVAADLSEASIEDLMIQMMAAKDSRGLKFSNKARRLIVADANWYEASRIVKSVLQNDTANNAVNVLKMNNDFPEGILKYTYLTDPDAWFIQSDCGGDDCLTHYTRMATEFGQDSDFDTKNLKASAVARWSRGWSNFRGIYGSEGA
jgi:hypothetical protein